MEKYQRITDDKVFEMIERLQKTEDVDEKLTADVLETFLKLMLDTRQFLRKVYKNMPKKAKVYKRPTGNKNDVIVGDE